MTPGQRCDEIIKIIDEALDTVRPVEHGAILDVARGRTPDAQIVPTPLGAC